MTSFPPLIQPGDRFRVSTPKIATGGTVTKVNRTTFDYEAPYFDRVLKIRGNLGDLHLAVVVRGETVFTIL